MSNKPNKFGWYELVTTDMEAAGKFYHAVLGWDLKPTDMGAHPYTLLMKGDAMMAGMMTLPDEAKQMGAPPAWVGYVVVDDTGAYAAKIEAKGGKVLKAPTDIPGIGNFAVVADPQGAVFMLFTPGGEAPAEMPKAEGPGTIGWHELFAVDGAAAFDFYSELFGWQKGFAMDMGEMGTYQVFTDGTDKIGGMMNKPADMPRPCWLYYFNVEEINAATERVKANGGHVNMGPHEVPTGEWVASCVDPQGVHFALLAPPAK